MPRIDFDAYILQELELLNENANVYKLIGPVLVKQDLAEANANVRKRIEYISAELWVSLPSLSLLSGFCGSVNLFLFRLPCCFFFFFLMIGCHFSLFG